MDSQGVDGGEARVGEEAGAGVVVFVCVSDETGGSAQVGDLQTLGEQVGADAAVAVPGADSQVPQQPMTVVAAVQDGGGQGAAVRFEQGELHAGRVGERAHLGEGEV